MKRILLLAVFAISFLCRISAESKVYEVKSPDKKICFSLKLDDDSHLAYKVAVAGKDVIDWSVTGYSKDAQGGVFKYQSITPFNRSLLAAEEGSVLEIGQKAKRKMNKPLKVNSQWKPIWGKRAIVRDNYSSWDFKVNSESGGMIVFNVRVYNDGIAFKYSLTAFDEPGGYEHTEFNFADDYTAWYYNGERHNIGPEKLSDASGERLPLMTIKAADDLYLALHEANLSPDGWPMRLRSEAGKTRMSVIPEKISDFKGEFVGAWRVLMVGRTPGDLVDSHLIELLNPEPFGDYSWVKPGVYLWDWRIDGAVWEG